MYSSIILSFLSISITKVSVASFSSSSWARRFFYDSDWLYCKSSIFFLWIFVRLSISFYKAYNFCFSFFFPSSSYYCNFVTLFYKSLFSRVTFYNLVSKSALSSFSTFYWLYSKLFFMLSLSEDKILICSDKEETFSLFSLWTFKSSALFSFDSCSSVPILSLSCCNIFSYIFAIILFYYIFFSKSLCICLKDSSP